MQTGGNGGIVKFAEPIDSSIKTRCIGCPPDEVPAEWYCAWNYD